jgi:hypothetical protein
MSVSATIVLWVTITDSMFSKLCHVQAVLARIMKPLGLNFVQNTAYVHDFHKTSRRLSTRYIEIICRLFTLHFSINHSLFIFDFNVKTIQFELLRASLNKPQLNIIVWSGL